MKDMAAPGTLPVVFKSAVQSESAEVLDLLRDGGVVAHTAVVAKRRAQTDEQLMAAFLRSRAVRASSLETYAKYLRQYLFFLAKRSSLTGPQVKSVRLLQTEHWYRLIRWMRFPPAEDVMVGGSVAITEPAWRPLRGRSGDTTIIQALMVIQQFHGWMLSQGVMVFDPFKELKPSHLPDASIDEETARREAAADPERRLFEPSELADTQSALQLDPQPVGGPEGGGRRRVESKSALKRQLDDGEDPIAHVLTPEAIAMAFRVVEQYPQDKPEQRRRYARDRWALVLAFASGLRAAELARAMAKTLKLHRSKDGPHASMAVRRKGKKVKSRLPIPGFALEVLEAQYEAFGVSLAVAMASDLPLVLPVRGVAFDHAQQRWTAKQLDRKQLWWLFNEIFQRAAQLAQDEGWEQERWAPLAQASTHWARHTFGTTLSELAHSVVAAQYALGHSKPATTAGTYLHITDDALRKEMERAGSQLVHGAS